MAVIHLMNNLLVFPWAYKSKKYKKARFLYSFKVIDAI